MGLNNVTTLDAGCISQINKKHNQLGGILKIFSVATANTRGTNVVQRLQRKTE